MNQVDEIRNLVMDKLGWDSLRAWKAADSYINLKKFRADGNIFESGQTIDSDTHRVIRLVTEHYIKKAFDAMLIKEDENTKETPRRIAKVWCGDSLHCDTELGGGRFSKPVRLPKFPFAGKRGWIEKEVRLISTCSHHLLPFTGKAIIRYLPDKFVLGISKLQRLTNYVANRFYLQEDLTLALHNLIMEAAEVSYSDVEVKIIAEHSCETARGVKNIDCPFITEEK